MKRRVAKATVILFEAAGVFLAASAAFAAFLYWRLQSGPVSLDLFKHSAEFAIERVFPKGREATIGSAFLSRGAGAGAYDLRFQDIEVKDRSGKIVGALTSVTLEFSANDLFRGALGPRRIIVVNPKLKIERGVDRRLSIGYARDDAPSQNVFRTLTGGRYSRKPFQSAELLGSEIEFVDDASGRSWRAKGADARIDRTGEGYAAKLDGVFEIDGKAASMNLGAAFDEKRGVIRANLHVVDAPVGDILSMFYGPAGAVVSAPLTGDAAITLTSGGEVLSSRLEGRSGPGEFRLGETSIALSALSFAAAFDPKTNEFQLKKLRLEMGGSKAEFSGSASVRFAQSGLTPKSVAFDLVGENVLIAASAVLQDPLPVDRVEVSGVYDIAERRLSLENVNARLEGVEVVGDLSLTRYAAKKGEPAPSPEIRASIDIKGALDKDRLMRLWPLTVGVSARDFVSAEIPKGYADNISFKLNLPAGALAQDQTTPDDAIALSFDLHDVTAIYSDGMTPLSGASGKGLLSGNRFVISGLSAKIGKVAVSDGVADFTALSPPGEPVRFSFTAKGAAKDILGVLNEEPLSLLASTHLDPDRFVGDGVVRAEITRPNLNDVPREDYGFSGHATFAGLTITEFYGGYDLTDATGELDLKSRSMTLTADAKFGGAPIRLEWLQKFYADDGPSRFHISGTVNSATGDIFGVPTREMVRGPVDFDAHATGELGAIDRLTIEGDFTRSALAFDLFGWSKAQGAPATGSLDLTFGKDGLKIRSAKLVGESVDIEGSAELDAKGRLQSAAFPRFFLAGGADVSMTATRGPEDRLDIGLTGPFLNLGPFVEDFLQSGRRDSGKRAGMLGDNLSVRARLDAVALRQGVRYLGASLDFDKDAERLNTLDFSAHSALGGSPLSVAMSKPDRTGARRIEANTEDVGALIAGVFGVTSVRGGGGIMTLDLAPAPGADEGTLTGSVEAKDLRVFKAPLLAKIFAAGSLTGLGDLLNGDGIELAQAHAKFSFSKGVFTLEEARASGPSVGITGRGTVSAGQDGEIRLGGAVAPMYQVNSILGKAPLVGDLLVGRPGEGLVALDYQVTGKADAPTVTVNPLSALTPGFLRRMFDLPGAAAGEAAPAEETPKR
ncbi:MAG: hypothetical protein GC153_05575 [Alphaproteobacteria bacterium]|nr:hypothetical protein [Alphaproteobacteria bacterium]